MIYNLLLILAPFCIYLLPAVVIGKIAAKNSLNASEYVQLYLLLPLYAPFALYQDIKLDKGLSKK